MYTQEEYLYGWLFYLLGVALIMGCGWLLTARMRWREGRQLLRLLVAVTLLVPWYATPEMHFLAPAWIVAGFEGVFDNNFWRAGGPLLSALAAAVTVAIVWQVLARFVIKKG